MNPKEHWETIYSTKAVTEVSWFQRQPAISLDLIGRVAPDPAAAIIDIGGGASTLVDGLIARGYSRVTVLDIAARALAHAQGRLGANASGVRWICGDLLQAELAPASIDVWHDRAVFHFLVDTEQRRKYVSQVRRALRPGGHVIVATFAEDGPTRCSGLEVARYSAAQLHGAFGDGFRLLQSVREEHHTPSGGVQAFQYCLCAFDPAAAAAA